MIIKVSQKVVSLKDCVCDVDVLNKVRKEIGNTNVIKYSFSPKDIVFYIEDILGWCTIDIEAYPEKHVSAVDVVYELFEKFPSSFKKTNSTVIYVLHDDEIDEYIQKMSDLVDSYIGKRIPNNKIEFVDGAAQIVEPNGDIVLLFDKYVLEFDPASLDIQDESERNTTMIRRSGTIHENYFVTSGDLKMKKEAEVLKNDSCYECQSERDGVQKMKELLINVHSVSDNTTMAQAVKNTTLTDTTTEKLSQEVQRINKVSEVNNVVISFDAFDNYASKHHVVGCELVTSSTLSIEYIEGTTPESTIKKIHDIMDSVDMTHDIKENVEFLSNLKHMIINDTDIAGEFITRVNKHNEFVDDCMSKIRKNLLDIESVFEHSLKNEVSLSIDWDKLSVYAAKKERTEHRVNGVEKSSSGSNVVRVDCGEHNSDFYIPKHILTDELRSIHVVDDCPYYIEDAPDYAFYQITLNGHFILIENTKL